MSDFRKPRADHPIYPTSAIYRPTTSRGWVVPKGLKGKKGGKKKKKGKKATYDPETIARVHQQTSKNKERELLHEQLDYRRAQRVIEEEQRERAAQLAEERRNDERARFALEARQMGAQRAFFQQIGNAAAGIAAGVGARAGAAGGALGGAALPHAGVAVPPAVGGAPDVIHLHDAPRFSQRDLERHAANVEDRMRAAAQAQDQAAIDAIRRQAAAEVDAARRAGRMSDEQAARMRAELEQRYTEQIEALGSRARAAEEHAREADAEVERLRQQVLEGRAESAEALARLKAISEEEELEPQGEGGGLVRQRTTTGPERRRPPLSEQAQIARDIEAVRREVAGERDSWVNATSRLVEEGSFADYGVTEMDEKTQYELDQIGQRLVFTPGMSKRERQRQAAAMNARWFDFLDRRRLETGARGTFRPKHSPSMEALSAQLALEDVGAQPEPEGTEGGGAPRPQPPGGRGSRGSRGRSARNVVSPMSPQAAAHLRGMLSPVPKGKEAHGPGGVVPPETTEGGGGEGPPVQHAIGEDPKSREGLPRAERDIEPAARGVERPKEFVPVRIEPVKPTPRPPTPPIIIGIPGEPPPPSPRIPPLVTKTPPQPAPEPEVEPEPQPERGRPGRPFGLHNIVRHKRTGRVGYVSEGPKPETGPDNFQLTFFDDKKVKASLRAAFSYELSQSLKPPPKLGEEDLRELRRLRRKEGKESSDRLHHHPAPTKLTTEERDRLADLDYRDVKSLEIGGRTHESSTDAVDEGVGLITPGERLELLRQLGQKAVADGAKGKQAYIRLSEAKDKEPFRPLNHFEDRKLWLESDDWSSAGTGKHYKLSKAAQERGEGEGERLFLHSYDPTKSKDRGGSWLYQREKGHLEDAGVKNTSGRGNISHDALVAALQAQEVRLRRDGDEEEATFLAGAVAGAQAAAEGVGRLGVAAGGMMGGAVGGAARIAWEAAGSPTARDVAEGTGRLAARGVVAAGSAALEVGGGLVGLAVEGGQDLYEQQVGAPARIARLPSAPGGLTGYEQSARPGLRLQTESEIEAEQAPLATGSSRAHPGFARRITNPQPADLGGGASAVRGLGAANEPPVDWGTPRGGMRSDRDPQQRGGGEGGLFD